GEGHARHHDDRAHRREADGEDRLDPAVDTRVSLGELEDPDGPAAPRRRAGMVRDRHQPQGPGKHRAGSVADLHEARQHPARGRGRRSSDAQLLAAGTLLSHRPRTRDPRARDVREATRRCGPGPRLRRRCLPHLRTVTDAMKTVFWLILTATLVACATENLY